MANNLTIAGKSVSADRAEAEIAAPVTLGHSDEATSSGASHAGPRVERAEARQQRDASTAPVNLSVIASDITDYKAFVAFLHEAGFSRGFAKLVTNGDAFKSAAEPSADDSQIAEAIKAQFALYRDTLKG